MAEKIYKADGTEIARRRSGVPVKMTTVNGQNAYVELNDAELAQKAADDAFSAAWKALKNAYPGRAFTSQERKALKAAVKAGQVYRPGPAAKTLEEQVTELQKTVATLVEKVG